MKHDGKIDIATAKSVDSRIWKNQKWKWSDLVDKLSKEYKTRETLVEFLGATKKEQGHIKNVGGYVGGYLRNGRRKPQNVVHRQLIVLDVDFAHLDFWETFKMQFNNSAAIHGTHKHSLSSPRYRLIIPLNRECAPDEFVAISRSVAGLLGIDLFDNTTFETHRLMFWPSSPSDVDYYFEFQDGPWLDADKILESYVDWTDSSAWPIAGSKLDEIKDASKKQEDPETKKGVIGAFCRTYGIEAVISKFLQDSYVSTGHGDRYTYIKGSAAAGLTIYEDKFAYSHHGTDPCGGKLCNSFDLVRIHKFGHLDNSTNISDKSRSKSFEAMEHFCTQDFSVKRTLAKEKMQEIEYDFSEPLEENGDSNNLEWMEHLEIDSKGKYLSSATNINLIFARDQRLQNIFKENLFDNKKYLMRSLPWRKIEAPEPIKDVDFSGVRNYFESIYSITGNVKIEDSLRLEFQKNSFHPIRDYLKSLEWDGERRIDYLLIDYFGTPDSLYFKEAIRKPLVAAVGRVFNPGIKFDLVLTLVGDQGCGKSTFISKLGKSWYSDTFSTVKGKEAFEQLQGAWLLEMAELAGLRKAEVETIKHFLSKQEDTYRPAFGRTVETYKRQNIFMGTTNNMDFLRDSTGNRRFIPVDVQEEMSVKSVFSKDFDKIIDQIWAEAYQLFLKGEPLYLSSEAEKSARIEQKAHSQLDERTGLILDYLDALLPEDWSNRDIYDKREYFRSVKSTKGSQRDFVCVAEIWCECLGKEKAEMSRYNTRDLNEIMRSLEGWEPSNSTKNFPNYGKQKYYSRKLY